MCWRCSEAAAGDVVESGKWRVGSGELRGDGWCRHGIITRVYGNNLAEVAPWLATPVLLYGRSWYMQGGILNMGVQKEINIRFRHCLCMTIEICEFRASGKGSLVNVGDIRGYGDGCEFAAIHEGLLTYAGDEVGDFNRCQTRAPYKGMVGDVCHGRW